MLAQIGFDRNNFDHLICPLDSEVQIHWFIPMGQKLKCVEI